MDLAEVEALLGAGISMEAVLRKLSVLGQRRLTADNVHAVLGHLQQLGLSGRDQAAL